LASLLIYPGIAGKFRYFPRRELHRRGSRYPG
jgi:hypothetical protein